MEIDIKAAQLLNSRLFHDLLGAVTAINNGIEFLEDPAPDAEAVSLLRYSADRLRRRIDFFRGAFGLGAGNQGKLSLAEAEVLVNGWFADSKSSVIWPGERSLESLDIIDVSLVKVLMILSMIAEESLPRGGEVLVAVTCLSEGLGLSVSASGIGACYPRGVEQVLANSCPLDDLSARNVVAYMAVKLANSLGARIEAAQLQDRVDYASLIPTT